jgi:uncharacterized surface protein with fasciclin (FAS1) repeats
MRRIVLAVTAAALALSVVAAPAAARTASSPSIVDVAVAANTSGPLAGQFDTLIAAVVASPKAYALLTSQRQLTVFAPTDAAFAELGLNADNVGSIDTATLTSILAYHVAPGRRDSGDVVDSTRIRTIQGGFLRVSLHDGGAYVNDARIIAVDVPASNGIIHVIDAVLLP